MMKYIHQNIQNYKKNIHCIKSWYMYSVQNYTDIHDKWLVMLRKLSWQIYMPSL